jgi:uncharacterized lipoprotein YmbA
MLNKIFKRLMPLLISTLLSACISTPSTNFYVLEALSKPSASPTDAVKKHLVGIGPVSMPAFLERKQIVTRMPDHSIQIAEFHQWAAPLKDNVTQVLTHNLATLQPNDIIRAYPWIAYGAVDYRIIVDIIRFDTTPQQTVNLEVNWAIMDEKTHTLLSNGRSKIEHPLDDPSYPGTVKALNKILSEFSQELSLALGKIK